MIELADGFVFVAKDSSVFVATFDDGLWIVSEATLFEVVYAR